MLDSIHYWLGLGVEPKELTFFQISVRGIIVFLWALLLVRFSDRRSLTKKSPFDIVLIVILASVLARAINGNSSFYATLGAAAVLVLLHRALAFASCRWQVLNTFLKGRSTILVADGQWQEKTMRRSDIARLDIEEDLRLNTHCDDISQVKIARLEINGDISFILHRPE